MGREHRHGSPWVLILDSAPHVAATALSGILDDEQIEARVVTNGEDALSILEGFQPSLIFIDEDVPGVLDEAPMLRLIRRDFSDGAIFLMLARPSDDGRLVTSMRIASSRYVRKPLDVTSLLGLVAHAMGRLVAADEPAAPRLVIGAVTVAAGS